MNRYMRGDAVFFAPAINNIPIEKECAFEYVKTIRSERGKLIVEYTNEESKALKLPITMMDSVIDFLNKWNKRDKIIHIKK